MENRILLLEDDVSLIDGLQYSLKKNGFDVDFVRSVQETLTYLSEIEKYDMLILDVTLPDGTGFEICEKVRKNGSQIPIIFLTASDEEVSIIRGLDCGGDDYITKPFSSRELLARIKRITKKLDKTMTMNFGDISIDFDKKQVCKNGNPVVLTALEYRLFAMLAKNSGKVLTREQILERIWDLSGNYVEDNTLTVYIKRLRKKLDTDMIKTVKGLGYRLEV